METVRLHKDDIKALTDDFGTKYQTPGVPRDNALIGRGLKSLMIGGALTGGIREFQILPFPRIEPNPKVTLQLLGYAITTDVPLTDMLLWLVEVNAIITGTTQAIAAGEFCNTPDELRALYPNMAEMSNSYVRTIGPVGTAGGMTWIPIEGNAGLLDKGNGLAFCLATARNTSPCLQGMIVAREYNAR